MRVSFYEIFDVNRNELTPKVPIHLGGIKRDRGVSFSDRESFGDDEILQHIGNDLEVEKRPDGVNNILKIYL